MVSLNHINEIGFRTAELIDTMKFHDLNARFDI